MEMRKRNFGEQKAKAKAGCNVNHVIRSMFLGSGCLEYAD
jgi:hypothetical protein